MERLVFKKEQGGDFSLKAYVVGSSKLIHFNCKSGKDGEFDEDLYVDTDDLIEIVAAQRIGVTYCESCKGYVLNGHAKHEEENKP